MQNSSRSALTLCFTSRQMSDCHCKARRINGLGDEHLEARRKGTLGVFLARESG